MTTQTQAKSGAGRRHPPTPGISPLLAALAVVGAGMPLATPTNAARLRTGQPYTVAQTAAAVSSAPAHATHPDIEESLVVWSGIALSTPRETAPAIFGRRLSANGETLGDRFRISPGFAVEPAAVYNRTRDEYFVAYRTTPTGTEPARIAGRRFDAQGKALSEEITLFTAPELSGPALAWNADGNRYLAVAASGSGLLVRIVAGDGSFPGQELNLGPAAVSIPALLVVPERQGYLLAFETSSGAESDIQGQFLSGTGRVAGNPLRLAAMPGRQTSPALARIKQSFALTWTDWRKPKPRVFAKRFGNAGISRGTARLIDRNAEKPRLGPFRSGGLLAVWSRPNGPAIAKLLKGDLSAQTPAFRLSEPKRPALPTAGFLKGTTEMLALWGGQNQAGIPGIYAQRVKTTPLATVMTATVEVQSRQLGTVPDATGKQVPVKGPVYKISVTNSDSVKAQQVSVSLTSTFPLNILSDFSNCKAGTADVACNLGDLAPGATVELSLRDREGITCITTNPEEVTGSIVVDWKNRPLGVATVKASDTGKLCF